MFGLSLKGKYGLAALLELGLYEQAGPIQIKTIAKKRSIPQKYLEQVLMELKRENIVKSFRGSQGGYALAKPSDQIKIYDILSCLEGPCLLSGNSCDCHVLKTFWEGTEEYIKTHFQVTLDHLIKEKLRETNSLVYNI